MLDSPFWKGWLDGWEGRRKESDGLRYVHGFRYGRACRRRKKAIDGQKALAPYEALRQARIPGWLRRDIGGS